MNEKLFGTEKISKILLKIAPPVMFAQLIQALYNIVDSIFVGRYSETGLTALSIIFPIQLLMIAIATGTGVGINTSMSYSLGLDNKEKAEQTAGTAAPIALVLWFIFALISWWFIPFYARISTNSQAVIDDVIAYGRITCIFSIGLFLESCWTKVHQAYGNMKTPMIAQIVGAIINIVLDPILIFGLIGMPKLGVTGAAIATVVGQIVAAIIVMIKGVRKSPNIKLYPKELARIYQLGLPNIIMQAAYTFYIFGLNIILKGFSDQAVTALGVYYKWQTFFFIPLGSLQTCIVPILSYNYASNNMDRCKKTLNTSLLYGMGLMFLGTLCFEFLPAQMMRVFSSDPDVISIGTWGFRFIGISFIPQVTSLIYPVFFQAVDQPIKSSLLTFVRTLFLFVPLGYIFSRFGLKYFWLTYPVTETITSIIGYILYRKFLKKKELDEKAKENKNAENIMLN